ncbi:hypothetical protein SRM_00605 [Salinibacter ruber M8]|uniref:Uncharacterized protein n=1 Tax=Salinibacter ruber (strain M8) TaxID=761659 RepID=D5H671_SALRM|nr:hypothetical protein SRM_00605 [Salinibacter ruber M8]
MVQAVRVSVERTRVRALLLAFARTAAPSRDTFRGSSYRESRNGTVRGRGHSSIFEQYG